MNYFFTPERRQAIQLVAVSLAPLFILFGLGTESIWEQILIITGAALMFVSNLLSLINLRRGDWSKGWEIVRGAVYTFGLAVAPALVALNAWTPEFASTFTLGLSLSLAALGNIVAVLTSGHQEKVGAVEKAVALYPYNLERRAEFRERLRGR